MSGAMFIINLHATGSIVIKSLVLKKARKGGRSAEACTQTKICCVSRNYT
jgi:hypothetical protein